MGFFPAGRLCVLNLIVLFAKLKAEEARKQRAFLYCSESIGLQIYVQRKKIEHCLFL
jgi:hypothetical protein